MASSPIRCVQLNACRTALVNDQLLDYARNHNIDLALIQEPYTFRGRLSGLEASPIRVALSKGHFRPGAHPYRVFGAALVVFEPTLFIVHRQDLSDENTVAVTTTDSLGESVTWISAYFRYRSPTASLVMALETKLRLISGPVIISADSNAFSTRWYSRISDHRGRLVEAFIDAEDLICMNRRSNLTTFNGRRGRTNLDITLCSRTLAPHIANWSIIADQTSSDHNLIRFDFVFSRAFFANKKPRFNTGKANWPTFRALLADLCIPASNDPNF